MTYVLDTNILLHTIRNEAFYRNLNEIYHFFESPNISILSAVTVGEIRSIAIRNRWGERRMTDLLLLLKKFKTIPVTGDDAFTELYALIDTYSQNQHPTLRLIGSARKMGKNDLWIATTTALFNATLLSTDNDFEHLNNVFIYFDKIEV
jgi:predicted nucleic acid-binding protein